MWLSPNDLRDIHATFGTAKSLIERRRATYSAVVELAADPPLAQVPVDLIDSPLTRAHLGEVIIGDEYRPDAMVPLSKLVTGARAVGCGDWRAYVVADPASRAPLAGAVEKIASELGGSAADAAGIHLLLGEDPDFGVASRTVIEGLELAASLCPELADDLLPHVTLFAIVGCDERSGRLGSASVREYPGLIVLPRPTGTIEVAEALMHEGAHQKFFDLGMNRSIFNADFCYAPFFRASWSPSAVPRWPLEQCVAAFHAYSCMAVFWEAVCDHDGQDRLHDFSLLPVAQSRAAELGNWIAQNSQFLGPDGQQLLGLLQGVADLAEPACTGSSAALELRVGRPTVMRRCGEWTLVAQLTDHVELHWLPSCDVRDPCL